MVVPAGRDPTLPFGGKIHRWEGCRLSDMFFSWACAACTGAGEHEKILMKRFATLVTIAQAMLTVCCVLLSIWGNVPILAASIAGILGASGIATDWLERRERRVGRHRTLARMIVWLCTFAIGADLVLETRGRGLDAYLDPYYGAIALLIAAS